jgi:hypothetical protein
MNQPSEFNGRTKFRLYCSSTLNRTAHFKIAANELVRLGIGVAYGCLINKGRTIIEGNSLY